MARKGHAYMMRDGQANGISGKIKTSLLSEKWTLTFHKLEQLGAQRVSFASRCKMPFR
jgi:hypothetical protein